MDRRQFLSFIGIAVSGCAYTNTRDPLYRSYVTEIPEKHGFVFGSLGHLGRSPYASIGFPYRAKGFQISRAFLYLPGSLPQFDFAEGNSRGSVFFAQLAPAEYEIFNFHLVHDMGPLGRTIFRSRAEFSVPFSITEGRATYLGQILTVVERGKNIFGMTMPAGGYFVVSDQMERDLRLLQSQFKDLDISKIDRALIEPKVGSPFFPERTALC
jgi:hypothetical protein